MLHLKHSALLKIYLVAIGLISLFCVPCIAETTDEITEPFFGVRHIHRITDTPRPLHINILEIDLNEPNILFYVTPAGPHQGPTYWEETYRLTTRNFLIEQNAQMAINGSFSSALGDPDWLRVIRGLAASNGNAYSPFESPTSLPWPVLNISQNNVVSIVDRASDFGFDVSPSIPLYNAVSGNERIVTVGIETAGQITWGEPTNLHPRTAAGITADQKIVLVTVDGRQSGFSEGMRSAEVAELLIEFGVIDAVNLDGGGSTTMVIAAPTPIVVNSPSGSERANTTNIAIFATLRPQPISRSYVYADFENGNESTFNLSPGYSGSTNGINEPASSADAVSTNNFDGNWSQKLVIVDDATVSGGWKVRHISGPGASREQNHIRLTTGSLGFWAKTNTAGLEITIAIDDTNNTTADLGVRKPMSADGNWHLYQWNLENDNQWEGWVNGDGIIDTVDFTIDSIQIFGPDINAEIFIDHIAHNTIGSLEYLFSKPGDFEPDGDIDFYDFAAFSQNWLIQDSQPGWNALFDISIPADNIIDFYDLKQLVQNWLN